jgi:hypothetical protein
MYGVFYSHFFAARELRAAAGKLNYAVKLLSLRFAEVNYFILTFENSQVSSWHKSIINALEL